VTRGEANRLRALGCAIGGASLLFLAYRAYGAFAQGQPGAIGWCAGFVAGALCAFALAVVLRWRAGP
jgi:hypothetical protein